MASPLRRHARLWGLYALYCLGIAMLFLLAAEGLLRWRGEQPWRPEPARIDVEPGGRFYQRHDTLGYSHIPGRFDVLLATGYRFRATHGPDTLRLARPAETPARRGARPVWIFGGSFTYGWSVDDSDSYPWILQAQRPDLAIVNFGVNGYGTLHSWIQLQHALEMREKPWLAVLAYGSFHDVRNTFLRKRRKRVAPFSQLGPLVQPYARLDAEGHLQIAMSLVEYREVPLMRVSALVHFLERRFNDLEERALDSGAVTRAIVLEFARTAREAGVTPLFVTITDSPASDIMRDFAARQGLAVADIAVDLGRPGFRNLPHDGHPSALAQRAYAERLGRAIRALESRQSRELPAR